MLKTKLDIEQFLKKFNITNYSINCDMSVDVNGNVNLSHGEEKLTEIPIQFNNVFGYFTCSYQKLTSLKGSPKYVEEDFDCDYNLLTSLKYCPTIVNGAFYANNNQLITLAGDLESVNSNIFCSNNPLTSLKGLNARANFNLICDDSLIEELILEELPLVKHKIFLSHREGKKILNFEEHYNSDNTLVMELEDIKKTLLFYNMHRDLKSKEQRNTIKI